MRNKQFFWIVATGILLFSGAAFAKVYTWVDKNGQTHFGHEAPQNASSTEVELFESVVKTESDLEVQQARREKQKRYLEVLEEDRNARATEWAHEEASRKGQRKLCKQASIEAKDYKVANTFFYTLNEEGDRTYMTPDQIKEKIYSLEDYMKRRCR